MKTEPTSQIQVDWTSVDFEVLETSHTRGVVSYSLTPSRTRMLFATLTGFAIADLVALKIQHFKQANNPFYRNETTPCGVSLGSLLQQRTQVALVPNFTSRRFSETCVYIFDHCARMILSKFDFHLPISQLQLTHSQIIVANNKRLLVYNYTKTQAVHTEEQYLAAHRVKDAPDYLKRFELYCHSYEAGKKDACGCGRFAVGERKGKLVLFFLKVGWTQNSRSYLLMQYDESKDKLTSFLDKENELTFTLATDARYLLVAEEGGCKISVFNLVENCLQTVLYVGMTPRRILSMGVVTITASANRGEWVLCSRERDDGTGTFHFFKLGRTSPTEKVVSKYQRSFHLQRKEMKDEGVLANPETPLGPDYFISGERLFSISLAGEYCQLLEFPRVGLHHSGKSGEMFSLVQK